jgi:hypothetical protein
MAKQQASQRLIGEKLRTTNNLYDYSLDTLAELESLRQTKGCSQKELKEGYGAIGSCFKEALLFGEGSSSYPLAYLHFNGYGVKKDMHQAKLYVAIGANFKDENCIKLMRGEDPKILGNTSGTNMGKWLKYNYADVTSEATQWINAIQTITTRCNDKDAEITSADMVWVQAQLDHCKEPHLLYPAILLKSILTENGQKQKMKTNNKIPDITPPKKPDNHKKGQGR